ncbi:MAG: SAM-dependent methyltransferase [Saprospiraceae bacterium]|nr:SAM-dependent methyltransferase [Saprospiraceae bacterium]
MSENNKQDTTLQNLLNSAIAAEIFVKGLLSVPSKDQQWNKILFKLVEIKKQIQLSLVYRYPTKDETKNYPLEEAVILLNDLLRDGKCKEAYIYNQSETILLKRNKKGEIQLHTQKTETSTQVAGISEHDRKKDYLIPADQPLLKLLGISSSKGEILSDGKRKYKQINKYLEILESLLKDQSKNGLHIVDMGSGSGYLTFSLYWYLSKLKGWNIKMTGIELREHLVLKSNELARSLEFEGLNFIAGDIQTTDLPEGTNVLIALHACDIATDMAIAKGIENKVEVMVLAPCCQKQIRKDMIVEYQMKPLLKHGILLERQCEMLTDGIRALLMEANGYKTSVFEFISPEHTAKNVMITGVRSEPRPEALDEVAQLKKSFGVSEHYLEKLLS